MTYIIKIGIGEYSNYYEEWYYSDIPITKYDIKTAFDAVKKEIIRRKKLSEIKIEKHIRKKYGDELYELYKDYGSYFRLLSDLISDKFVSEKDRMKKYSPKILENMRNDIQKISNDIYLSWIKDNWVRCAQKLGYLKSLKRLNPDIEYYESKYIW